MAATDPRVHTGRWARGQKLLNIQEGSNFVLKFLEVRILTTTCHSYLDHRF